MKYEIVIIGGGPAGLSAALYAGRAGKKTALIEKEIAGGQLMSTAKIENLPGASDQPFEVVERMKEQAENFACDFISAEVTEVDLKAKPKLIKTTKGDIEADALILANGAKPRKLGLEDEEKFIGRGLGYCATCDGAFFAGLPIYVVGGGDSAFDESLFLAGLSDKVTILYRGDKPRASAGLQERVKNNKNISLRLNSEVVKISGDMNLSSMIINNNKSGKEEIVEGDFGLFIYVGTDPQTDLYRGQLDLDEGYIKAGEDTRTAIAGVYAAGDIRKKVLRQVVTAIADGAVAAVMAGRDLDAGLL